MSLFGMRSQRRDLVTRGTVAGASLLAAAALAAAAIPATAQHAVSASPKAYIGLFGDNALAVIDTATD